MPTTYTVPDNPADVEAAALELIVRLPADILHTGALTVVLQEYAGTLHAGGAGANHRGRGARAMSSDHPQVRQPGLSRAFWPQYAHTDAMQCMVPAPR
jgi:hypothetical protein